MSFLPATKRGSSRSSRSTSTNWSEVSGKWGSGKGKPSKSDGNLSELPTNRAEIESRLFTRDAVMLTSFVISLIISMIVGLTTSVPYQPPYIYTTLNGVVVNAAVSASNFCPYDRSNYVAITWSAYNRTLPLYNKDSTLSQYTLPWSGNSSVNNTAVLKYDYQGKISQVLLMGQLGSSSIAPVTSISCKGNVVYIGGTVYNELVINDFNRALNDTDLIQHTGSVFILKYGVMNGSYLSAAFGNMENYQCTMLDMNATTNSVYAAITCYETSGEIPFYISDFCYYTDPCNGGVIGAVNIDKLNNAFSIRFTQDFYTGYAVLPSDTYKAYTYKSTMVYNTGNFAPDNDANFSSYGLEDYVTVLNYPTSFFATSVEYAYTYNRELNKAIWIDCPSFYITALTAGDYTLTATDLYSSVTLETPVKIWNYGNKNKTNPDKTILFANLYDVIIIKSSTSSIQVLGIEGAPLMISDFQLASNGNLLLSLNFLAELESSRTIVVTKFDGSTSGTRISITTPCYYLFVQLTSDGDVVNYVCIDSEIQPLSVINYGMFLSVTPQNQLSIASAVVHKATIPNNIKLKGTSAALNLYYNLAYGYFVI